MKRRRKQQAAVGHLLLCKIRIIRNFIDGIFMRTKKIEWTIHINTFSYRQIPFFILSTANLHHIFFININIFAVESVLSLRFDSKLSSGLRCHIHTHICTCMYRMRIRFRRSDARFNLNPFIIHYWSAWCSLSSLTLTLTLAKWEQSPGHNNMRCTSNATDSIGSPVPMCQLGNKDEQIEQIE